MRDVPIPELGDPPPDGEDEDVDDGGDIALGDQSPKAAGFGRRKSGSLKRGRRVMNTAVQKRNHKMANGPGRGGRIAAYSSAVARRFDKKGQLLAMEFMKHGDVCDPTPVDMMSALLTSCAALGYHWENRGHAWESRLQGSGPVGDLSLLWVEYDLGELYT